MYSFLICLAVLVIGYFTYGKFLERIIGPDASRPTVATTKADGVDFVPLPAWRIFMIQFLNIAGLGPIFGAIMGAKFGIASYLWIVLGTIFAGGMHDYVAGMISMRNGGESLPESIGRYLGMTAQQVMRFFTAILLILVAAVFISGPAGLLSKLTAGSSFFNLYFWIIVIFIYYVIATVLPIDKIIGRIYPLFSSALLFMEVGILGALLFGKGWGLPEFTDPVVSSHEGIPIFPVMFVSIACGAISGFHASQSPMMARCMKNEKLGRPVFYGAMIIEGIEALIWAAAATYFFHENGFGESNAAVVVDSITRSWLGTVGAVLAMLGVVFAPITSGDTSLRSARLIVADILKFDQKSTKNRLIISLPLLVATAGILIYSMRDAAGFDIIWRYFAWSNQMLATVTLWMITVYFVNEKKNIFIGLIPAMFMTAVTMVFILSSDQGFGLPVGLTYALVAVLEVVLLVRLRIYIKNRRTLSAS